MYLIAVVLCHSLYVISREVGSSTTAQGQATDKLGDREKEVGREATTGAGREVRRGAREVGERQEGRHPDKRINKIHGEATQTFSARLHDCSPQYGALH